MIQIQWEFLTVQTNISKEGNNYLEEKNESYRRMRIIYNNMIGTFITNQCVDEDFFNKKKLLKIYILLMAWKFLSQAISLIAIISIENI